jgi:hypothetical protein
MGNFGLGLRVMFRIWRDDTFAEKIRQLEAGKAPPVQSKAEAMPEARAKKESRRSEALSLLAVLQREARFVDFISEPIAGYSDSQVGAAARDVHKSCAAAVDRLFALQPMSEAAEGAQIEVPRGFDPAQFRLTGNIPNEPPFRGTLCHHGWKATKCEVPEWTGNDASAMVVAPAEVQIK